MGLTNWCRLRRIGSKFGGYTSRQRESISTQSFKSSMPNSSFSLLSAYTAWSAVKFSTALVRQSGHSAAVLFFSQSSKHALQKECKQLVVTGFTTTPLHTGQCTRSKSSDLERFLTPSELHRMSIRPSTAFAFAGGEPEYTLIRNAISAVFDSDKVAPASRRHTIRSTNLSGSEVECTGILFLKPRLSSKLTSRFAKSSTWRTTFAFTSKPKSWCIPWR